MANRAAWKPREAFVRYDCPHCRAGLEADVARWGGWILCPSCGKPGPPPPRPRATFRAFESARDPQGAGLRAEAWIASGDLPDESWPQWSRGLHLSSATASRGARRAATAVNVGLGLSLFLLLVGFLDQSGRLTGVGLLGFLICLWFRGRLAG